MGDALGNLVAQPPPRGRRLLELRPDQEEPERRRAVRDRVGEERRRARQREGEQRVGDRSDGRAEDRDSLPGPEQEEVAVATEWTRLVRRSGGGHSLAGDDAGPQGGIIGARGRARN